MQFKPGDRVVVTNPTPDHAYTKGKRGVVFDDGPRSGGLIAVRGIYGHLADLKGFHSFYAHEIRHA